MKKGAKKIESMDEPVAIEKTIDITGAKIKDDFCNYSYELLTGPTAGDSLSRSGASLVHDDMKAAFNKLKPHLAVICEEIDPSKISDISLYEELDPFGDYKKNSIESKVIQFFVTAFQLEGTGENGSIGLQGIKRLSTGDDLQLKTPRIKWEGNYQFVHELRAVIDELKREVEEYMNGKTAPKMIQQELFEGETEVVEGQ